MAFYWSFQTGFLFSTKADMPSFLKSISRIRLRIQKAVATYDIV
jgi:hypothetical protein